MIYIIIGLILLNIIEIVIIQMRLPIYGIIHIDHDSDIETKYNLELSIPFEEMEEKYFIIFKVDHSCMKHIS